MVDWSEVDYFTLLIIIADIQRAINNRFLTYGESADRELETMTTNKFLRPNEIRGLVLNMNDRDFAPSMLANRERLLRRIKALFMMN